MPHDEPRTTPKQRSVLVILSIFISGALELGVVAKAVLSGNGLSMAFGLALAIQFGPLLPNLVCRRKIGVAMLAPCSAASGVLVLTISELDLWILAVTVTVSSACLSVSRDALQAVHLSATAKRVSRVVGFFTAPLLVHDVFFALVLLSTAAIGFASIDREYALHGISKSPMPNKMSLSTIDMALISHQIHYFSYATLVFVTLLNQFQPLIAISTFVAGWVSYILLPRLLGARSNAFMNAVVGHIILAAVLAGMAVSDGGGVLWLTLWVATGFCAGTVVYLTDFAQAAFGYTKPRLSLLENLGHCLGATAAFLIVVASGKTRLLYIVAAMAASATALLMLINFREAFPSCGRGRK